MMPGSEPTRDRVIADRDDQRARRVRSGLSRLSTEASSGRENETEPRERVKSSSAEQERQEGQTEMEEEEEELKQ